MHVRKWVRFMLRGRSECSKVNNAMETCVCVCVCVWIGSKENIQNFFSIVGKRCFVFENSEWLQENIQQRKLNVRAKENGI